MISLLRSGKSIEEIKKLIETENLFSAATPLRSKQIFSTVATRVSGLSDRFFDKFSDSNVETQKLITLIAVMISDSLFFEFMNEVYREKMITSDTVLTDVDVRVFFTGKQRESEKVAAWTDETLDRLHRCYKRYLVEAGLLERGVGERKIIKPLVDSSLSALLSENDMKPILRVLTGSR